MFHIERTASEILQSDRAMILPESRFPEKGINNRYEIPDQILTQSLGNSKLLSLSEFQFHHHENDSYGSSHVLGSF